MTSNTCSLGLSVVVSVVLLVAAPPTEAQLSALRHERTPAISAFPEYPTDARLDRLEGEATVCFRIDSDGEVKRPKIRSSTDKIFERPTLKAIRASTFEPLEAGQIEPSVPVCRTYRFKLDQLDPLYVRKEPTGPQALPAGSTASLQTPDPPPQMAQGSLATEAAGAQASADPEMLIAEAKPLSPEEPICSVGTRPGTRIEYTFCYTPQQRAMMQSAGERDVRRLQEERRWQEEEIMRKSWSKQKGLGPR